MILIEGLDLAGKSTLVRELSRIYQKRGLPVRTSSNSLCANNPIATFTEPLRQDQRHCSLEGTCLLLAAHIWDVRNFTPMGSGMHLQDSCWLHSAAYDQEFGASLSIKPGTLWEDTPKIAVERTIFLTSSLPARVQRLRNLEQHHWLLEDPVRFCSLECRLLDMVSRHSPVEILDTSNLTPQQMAGCAMRILDSAPLQELAPAC